MEDVEIKDITNFINEECTISLFWNLKIMICLYIKDYYTIIVIVINL